MPKIGMEMLREENSNKIGYGASKRGTKFKNLLLRSKTRDGVQKRGNICKNWDRFALRGMVLQKEERVA